VGRASNPESGARLKPVDSSLSSDVNGVLVSALHENRVVPSFDETAEKVRGLIRRAVSPQQISFDDVAEALSRAVWTSRIGADRIAADGIDFFSGRRPRRARGR
jgi:hypothetical protein